MSEQPSTVDQSSMVVNEDPHPDPFDGNSVRISVTRPIEPGQLQDEIERRVKHSVQVALSTDEMDHVPSEGAPAVLFVSPRNINERVVRDVVAQHAVRPHPKRDAPGARPAPEVSSVNIEISDDLKPLVEKLENGETLKTSEASDLLRAILGITVQE